MPSRITPQQYGQAVLDHVQAGVYPESEELISADLPSAALPEISKLVEQAREDVKVSIRRVSRDSAPDIDGWISQAKQLRVDIQRSQEAAREIVEQAQHGERLEEKANDSAKKVDLLNGELAFNKSLAATLEQLQALRQTLDLIQRAILDNRLLEAADILGKVEDELGSSSGSKSTRVLGVFVAKATGLRTDLAERLSNSWHAYLHIDAVTSTIKINQKSECSFAVDMNSLVSAMIKLRLFDDVLLPLSKDIEFFILRPRLQVQADGTVGSLEIDGNDLKLSARSSDLSAQNLFSDLNSLIEFLRTQLPASVVEPLASLLMPQLISRLISTWLASAVPEDLDGMEDFEDTLSLVQEFAKTLDSYGWLGKRELFEWTKSIPNVWLRKRQETSLNQVRKLLFIGVGPIETVERAETQMLSHGDDIFVGNGGGDDWNAGWSDEEASPVKTTHSPNPAKADGGGDEDDVSAWGLDDEKGNEGVQKDQAEPAAADDDAEAWGWGDENENEETEPKKTPQTTKLSPKKATGNGYSDAPKQAEREVTLKETYNITSLPGEVLEIIMRVVSDATALETSDFANNPIAAASPNLLSLPGLILAMYRASASMAYSNHPTGPMFLYNDSLWLAERLQHLPSHQTTATGKRIQTRSAYNMNLKPHISAIESSGKRAYAKEMESQRTILTDLLDGAQGFEHCTEHPFNQECDIAIASTVDRLRDLHKQWKAVLSHSALLQSLGSLLSTITNKIVVDIEDMSDISEPESQQLATYCNRIAALEDLFLPTSTPPARTPSRNQARNSEIDPIPLTGLYAPHWLKFQYLANILESSLVDIKYLWTEGELGLEFDTEELVDLVVALFADSPHRRTAVAEIRGRRGVR